LRVLGSALVAMAVLLSALACASALPAAAGPETETGRTLYAGKCHGCHRLYAPARVTPEKWPALMEKMAAKSKLSEEEKRQVLAYVLAASASR
jgi:mono/diheme cytochrome c family protein